MRILLTNDDGIHAEGLAVLERIAHALSDEVWVVAPEVEQSGQSRALTLTAPLRVRQLEDRKFAVYGTPTDCVMLAVEDLMGGQMPDLVLSGVNRGQNLGEDVTVSGTVAGAIQGMMAGVPSIALSQALETFHDSHTALYETSEAYAPGIIAQLLKAGWPRDVVININFPDLKPDAVTGVEVTSQGMRDLAHGLYAERRTDLRGRHYYWMGFADRADDAGAGTDLRAIREGRIAVTPLHLDLTHKATIHELKKVLGGAPPKL
jgi:5'-nucleotidase